MSYSRTFVREVCRNASYRRNHTTSNFKWLFDRLWRDKYGHRKFRKRREA